jgi:hypothetical protein
MLLPILRRTGVNAAGLPRRLRHFVALLLRLAGRAKLRIPKPSPACLLMITLALGCLSCGVCVPRPSISGISPNSALRAFTSGLQHSVCRVTAGRHIPIGIRNEVSL